MKQMLKCVGGALLLLSSSVALSSTTPIKCEDCVTIPASGNNNCADQACYYTIKSNGVTISGSCSNPKNNQVANKTASDHVASYGNCLPPARGN